MSEQIGSAAVKPGDILNWPMLKVRYLTDPDKLARLLPPGLDAGDEAIVTITFYNFPVQGEPEYGTVIAVNADYQGLAGEYSIGYGIDQEQAIFISRERWGQPKFPARTRYYRLMDSIHASVEHQGFTFASFAGAAAGDEDPGAEFEHNEWWLKYSRSVDPTVQEFDLPPRVVRVRSRYGTASRERVEGQLVLRDSPWDPIARLLPLREQLEAYLWTPIFLEREISLAGALDPVAFWPFADTIGGSRWPGQDGGPLREAG